MPWHCTLAKGANPFGGTFRIYSHRRSSAGIHAFECCGSAAAWLRVTGKATAVLWTPSPARAAGTADAAVASSVQGQGAAAIKSEAAAAIQIDNAADVQRYHEADAIYNGDKGAGRGADN